jgi:hypothetical protein
LKSVPRDRFVSAVIETLAPFVGKSMAGAAVRLQLEKLGASGPTLSADHVEQLLGALAPGLNVFLGRPTTRTALDQVRAALDLRGGGGAS